MNVEITIRVVSEFVAADKAKERGHSPECVVFDSWYSSLENLKHIRRLGWRWVTSLKSNRKVNPDKTKSRPVSECAISSERSLVHLQGYGLIKVFRIDTCNGGTQYWATSDLQMDELTRLVYAELSWNIEEYHRGLKQHCHVEKAQVRKAKAIRNHIGLAIRAFVRLEWHRFTTGVSWFKAKLDIIRKAVANFLEAPLFELPTEPQTMGKKPTA
ncbi:MAG: transposase [Gemmataceae bacterium]